MFLPSNGSLRFAGELIFFLVFHASRAVGPMYGGKSLSFLDEL